MKKIFLVLSIFILPCISNSAIAQNIKGTVLTEAMTNKIRVDHLQKDSIVVSKVPYSYLKVTLLDSLKQILYVVYTDAERKIYV